MAKKTQGISPEDDEQREIAFRICELFFSEDRPTAEKIRDLVNGELKCNISREQIYPTVALARSMGFIALVPPIANTLTEQIRERFDLRLDAAQVVNVNGRWGGQHVATAGAERVLRIAQDVWAKKPPKQRDFVRIGLGPGRATLDFAHAFSHLIESEESIPPLELVAITAGSPAKMPQFAPASFFNLFSRKDPDKLSCVGFFGEVLVPAKDIDKIRSRPGAKEAFELRDKIDIVVSSMGDPKDDHDLHSCFLIDAGLKPLEDCCGNFQYRCYTDTQPIVEKGNQLRALTVFELEDFRKMANESTDRHVVLLARQCGMCGRSRAASLRPLMTSPELRVWNHVLMDLATARELLDDAPVD